MDFSPYVDVPAGPQKSDFLYTNFLSNLPPSVYHFQKKSTQFCPNWALFTIICQSSLCSLGSIISDENPPIAIPNFAKKHPKRQAHMRIPCQCENHPQDFSSWRLRCLFALQIANFLISQKQLLLGPTTWELLICFRNCMGVIELVSLSPITF